MQNKLLFKDSDGWLSLRRTPDGYVYAHEEKSDGRAIAVLVTQHGIVIGRMERCPAHDDPEPVLCAVTGLIEKGERADKAACREIEEETGFRATHDQLVSLGTVRQSKQTDTIVHLYHFDAGNQSGKLEPEGDGTPGEKGAYWVRVPVQAALWSKDPMIGVIMARRFGLQSWD